MRAATQRHEIRPAGWLASLVLFAVPAISFALLFHMVGPTLLNSNTSWWRIFHSLLILPLMLMLLSALVGAALDVPSISFALITERLRLRNTGLTTWLWAGALSGFMFGGQDLLAIAASWLALWRENHRRVWEFIAIPAAILVKRNAGIFQPLLQKVRFFDPANFYHGLFSRFGPSEFMGIPLHGAWWILVYYAVIMFVCNISGEELWWRGTSFPVKNWRSCAILADAMQELLNSPRHRPRSQIAKSLISLSSLVLC